jgi:hypothetical protein
MPKIVQIATAMPAGASAAPVLYALDEDGQIFVYRVGPDGQVGWNTVPPVPQPADPAPRRP